jgi:uncharacterized protein
MKHVIAALLLGAVTAPLFAATPLAVYTDPAPDKAYPPKMETVHIPTGDVEINGVVYVASGAGPHPTVILCHGLPGNEKNLDLAQALRRAGYTVITFNYRGSWGSPGAYKFAQNLEDADAVIAFARDPSNAAKLRVDPMRIAIVGHSMGGWVSALTAANDKALIGAVMISAGGMGRIGDLPRDQAIAAFRNNGMEALAGTSPEAMADEVIANRTAFGFEAAAPRLADVPLLILTSDDGLAFFSEELVAGIKAAKGAKLKTLHVATDHSWSDSRIRLQSEIIDWLATLKGK